jgi:spore coat protein U-like protein
MRMKTGLGVLTGLLCIGGAANATTAVSNFQVQLQIVAQCVINSTATLNFGSPGVLGGSGGTTNTDQTTTLAVQCTNTTPYDIGLDQGTTTGALVSQRLLLNSVTNETINYNLFTDAPRSIIWGNTVLTNTVHATGTGSSVSYTIYGRVPPQSTPTPGNYTDTVTVTITY